MKSFLRCVLALCLFQPMLLHSQNVFNPGDAIVRYDNTKPLGSAQNPNPNSAGLQKWVSTPTGGISTGSSTFDASSFKAYYLNVANIKMPFRVKFPRSYSLPEGVGKKYPVMIFLHGAGEAGCPSNNGIYNNEKQLALGGNIFRDYVDNNKFDGFLVYPQLTNASQCWGIWATVSSPYLAIVLSMTDSLGKYVRADVDRVMVDGLSGGAHGAWRMAAEFPQKIARIMPSAGVASMTNRALFVHIPIWFATGGKDPDPSPAQAQNALAQLKEIGADVRYTLYPNNGHAMWYNHWQEADFPAAMNDMHKANPLVFFQRNEYCAGESINTKLGITHNYYAYEWQKDGQRIAISTGGVREITDPSAVISFTGNEINVKALGTYRVHFKRTSSSNWSEWSLKPAVIKIRTPGPGPAITINGVKSKVLPALDGSTTVPLQMPSGFINYRWVRVSDQVQVSTSQTFNAPAGTYKAKYDVTPGCGPDFSPDFVVVNANGTPKPEAATNLTTGYNSASVVSLNWTQNANETNFEIYRSTQPGGPYTYLFSTNANVTGTTDNTITPNTTYFYVVRAVNNTGAAAPSNESSPNGGNQSPVIASLDHINANTDISTIENFTVSDALADVVTVTIPYKPGFVTLSKIDNTNYRITVNPTVNDIGFKEITVTATDNQGMFSSKKINLLVTDKDTRTAFINFGATGKNAALPWNNWTGNRGSGNTLTDVKDENNVATTWDVITTSGWPSVTTMGHLTGNNSGVYPDAVLESGLLHNGGLRQMKFSGLDLSKRYNLSFLGSQNEGPNATATYKVGTQTSTLNAAYNTQKTANLNNLLPDATGSIIVNIDRAAGVTNIYLSAVVIEEQAAGVLLRPENLFAETINRTDVLLMWSDKTSNETGFEIQRATDSLFTTGLTTISVAANTTSYKNIWLASNTKYWYRVRAKNGAASSGFSNRAVTITARSIVYVNFNTTFPNAPAPWNNLQATPMSAFTASNLKDFAGVATTIDLTLVLPFNGEFTAGRSTGNNSGVVPDNALQSNFWLDNSQVSRMRLSGLNTTRKYRIGFFGSSSSNGWVKGNYTATYTVQGRKVYLNSWENTSKVVYIGNITPNASGEVEIDFSTTSNANYGFNGGLIIHDYSDANGGTVMNSVLDELADANKKIKISIYPNPFKDQINVGFVNEWPGQKISAELYDLTGRLVWRNNYQQLPGGQNTLIFRAPSAGNMRNVYLFTLKANGKIVHSSKLMQE